MYNLSLQQESDKEISLQKNLLSYLLIEIRTKSAALAITQMHQRTGSKHGYARCYCSQMQLTKYLRHIKINMWDCKSPQTKTAGKISANASWIKIHYAPHSFSNEQRSGVLLLLIAYKLP